MSLWYAADRWKAFQRFHIDQYDVVLLNRSTMANAAYQGIRGGNQNQEELVKWIYELEFSVFGIPLPDLFFIFDIPVSLSRKNVAKKGFRGYVGEEADVYEKDISFLENVRRSYHTCAKIFRNTVVINCADEMDEMRPINEIASDIQCIIQKLLPGLLLK